ncbi:MAG: acyl-CoA dehydratase activase [Thermodesulfovibrionales bacterium]
MRYIGLDLGSVSVKAVVLDEKGQRIASFYERHKGHPLRVAYNMLNNIYQFGESFSLSVTGSAGKIISQKLGIPFTNEISAQAFATRRLYPDIRTIIELGGEDSKLIKIKGDSIEDFSMNSVCAAGTGSFLDQQAERLRLTIEEFSELALRSKRPARVAGRCSVFAKSDMIHLQQIATPVEDIVAGLCFAVARNFKGSIVRGRDIEEPVSFQGGVAANKGMVRAFKEVFGFDRFVVPDEFAFMGAIGAVLKDMEEGRENNLDLDKFGSLIDQIRYVESGHKPLVLENHKKLYINGSESGEINSSRITDHASRQGGIKAFLGIDIGSISTNLAVIDEDGNLLTKRYLMTAGRPIEAVNQGLREIGKEIGDKVEIAGVGTTGSGRYMIADYVGADIVKNEITAQATAAVFIDRTVDTIFEIGGQDSKYISLRDGIIVDFEMNKACAAGTGSFLEEQAEKLNISIKGEFAECACSAESPCRLGERCTVFMENSLMANLQKGADKNDLLAGLAYSIVQNYINKVVAGKPIGNKIFFQGGVAFNKAVVAAFENYLGKEIIVPPHHDVTGAIGMALIARDYMKTGESVNRLIGDDKTSIHRFTNSPLHRLTKFKGFDLSERPYEISSFECKGCPNVCEINRVKIEGEEGFLYYGGRCEKYDVRRGQKKEIEDLFAFREEMLWKEHKDREALSVKRNELKAIDALGVTHYASRRIGIPYIFFFHDYLPFWTTILWELGFEVVVSPKTNREIVNTGTEAVLADTCFPIKVAHGHIRYLIDNGIKTLLIPSFINMNDVEDEFERGFACPLTQTIPYAAKVAHPEVEILTPIVDMSRGEGALIKELLRVFKGYGIGRRELFSAIEIAKKAQTQFFNAIKSKGEEILSILQRDNRLGIVIVGRSYNASDKGVNLDLPRKLANLEIISIPFDFLDIQKVRVSEDWPNMYWKSGQRILRAARVIKNNPLLYPIYIGNFSCGPDSFILKYFAKELGGKPFLHLEIDEHSADAGAITRCEAFLDSIEQQLKANIGEGIKRVYPFTTSSPIHPFTPSPIHRMSLSLKERTIYIPRMSDHAFALAAAFEKCGIRAEVLPESDSEAIDLGRRYVSGKECYPCTVTTGDMLKKVLSPDFKPGHSAFFMPSGSGPCRFGQYNVFHRMVLDEVGFKDIPIFSPNQDSTFYRELGIVGKDFSAHAWKGIVAYELLNKCLHETRPYEKEKGLTEELYSRYLKTLYSSLIGLDGNVEAVLKRMREDFARIPRNKEERPLIGIVGEIFVRSHRFSNENLIRKIESLGGEAWLAPVEEWIYYVNLMGLRKALIKRDRSAIIEFLLKRFFQKRIEHRYSRHFRGLLKTLEEPDTKDILTKASPYLHDSFEGEAILSIGKTLDLIERGASGIINAMPFGCMPGTVVTSLMRGISRDFGIPCLSIAYDGTESPATEIQLEAFMSQAKEYNNK